MVATERGHSIPFGRALRSGINSIPREIININNISVFLGSSSCQMLILCLKIKKLMIVATKSHSFSWSTSSNEEVSAVCCCEDASLVVCFSRYFEKRHGRVTAEVLKLFASVSDGLLKNEPGSTEDTY